MEHCEHQKHPFVTFAVYFVTGTALFLHILSHLLPVFLILHNEKIINFLESPIVTVVAFLFIPLSIYHMVKDYRAHKTLHKLKEERDRARQVLSELVDACSVIVDDKIVRCCEEAKKLINPT
jgi:fumarate reductase subunit D